MVNLFLSSELLSQVKTAYRINSQVRIQRFKEVSQAYYVPVFPFAAVWISRSTSVIICVALSTLVRWLGARQCEISQKLHLS